MQSDNDNNNMPPHDEGENNLNNLMEEHNGYQYGYVPIGPNTVPNIYYQSDYTRTSLRREVFNQRGRTKQECQKLRRIHAEQTAILKTLAKELDDIGTLVFGDLEEEQIAIGKLHNMLSRYLEMIDVRLEFFETELRVYEIYWHDWMRRGIGENIPQYNLQ
jgi:hypothetical protein